MTALGDTVGNFRSLGAAAARLVADLLDGPEPCVHDLSEDVEWSRGWDRGWRSAEGAYGVGESSTGQGELDRVVLGAKNAAADAVKEWSQVPGRVLIGGSPAVVAGVAVRAYLNYLNEETRRAEGTQHAQAPGEVSADPSPDPAPSPGDYFRMPDSQLYARAAAAVFDAARCKPKVLEINALINLGEALLDRSAQLAAVEAEPFVDHEDLAAHITAARLDWAPTEPTTLTLDDALTSSLLADFYITKK